MKKSFILYPLSLIILAGCGDSDVRRDARQNMLFGCVSELGAIESTIDHERVREFCECAVNRILKNYTDSELAKMAVNPDAFEDRSNEDAVQAITACQDKLIPADF